MTCQCWAAQHSTEVSWPWSGSMVQFPVTTSSVLPPPGGLTGSTRSPVALSSSYLANRAIPTVAGTGAREVTTHLGWQPGPAAFTSFEDVCEVMPWPSVSSRVGCCHKSGMANVLRGPCCGFPLGFPPMGMPLQHPGKPQGPFNSGLMGSQLVSVSRPLPGVQLQLCILL